MNRSSLRAACLIAAACLSVWLVHPARAGDPNDAKTASAAVDLFVVAGQAAGLPLTQQEAEVVKQIVTCGLSGTSPENCAKNMAVASVMKQLGGDPRMTGAAQCLLAGSNAQTCLVDTVVSQLPVEAQPMASCVAKGQGSVAGCTKKFAEGLLIDKVPPDFQGVAKCMIDTQDARKCATDYAAQKVVGTLPANVRETARQIVTCLGTAANAASCVAAAAAPAELQPLVACATAPGANVGQCAASFAGAPDVAKSMIDCVGQNDFVKCAEQKGIAAGRDYAVAQPGRPFSRADKNAVVAALATIDRLRPDAPLNLSARKDNSATLRNILMVADGIKHGKWDEIVLGAGPELAIIASNILLSIFLTPPIAAALGPAVEAMIHNDVAAAQLALRAMARGDVIGLGKVVFKWYETSFIDKPCALIGDNKVQDAICGNLSKAIDFIADAGGDLAKSLLGTGKDVLQWLGVWGLADSVATDAWNVLKGAVDKVGHVLGLGDDGDGFRPANNCGSPTDYYANHYLRCVSFATDAASIVAGGLDTGRLNAACASHFNACVAPKHRASVTDACGAMSASLKNLAQQVGAGMRTAADTYGSMGGVARHAAASYQGMLRGRLIAADDICSPSYWKKEASAYASECARFVNDRFPFPGSLHGQPSAPACEISSAVPGQAARRACMASLEADRTKNGLAGPHGTYCRMAKDYVSAHPCKVGSAGAAIPIPGHSRPLDDITINCGERYRGIPVEATVTIVPSATNRIDTSLVADEFTMPTVLHRPPRLTTRSGPDVIQLPREDVQPDHIDFLQR